MKYNINSIHSTSNDLKVTVNKTGSKAMIRERGEEKATLRQGYRVIVGGETVGYGSWDKSERDLLLDVIKTERYAHLAYRERYYDLIQKLASIGFVIPTDELVNDRF